LAQEEEPVMANMNRYGDTARSYWAQWLPEQYAQIADPETFFAALSEYAALMIDELADEAAGDDPPGEGYLDKVARLTAARRQAEQVIMAALRPAPLPDDGDGDGLAEAVRPLVIWRGCPSWPEVDAEQREREGSC
jgi:hypothetical protein